MIKRCRVLPIAWVILLLQGVPLSAPVSAQDGIPPSSFVPADAVACPADASLTTERLRDLGATPALGIPEGPISPVDDVTPAGTPADAETTAAVTLTIRQYIACLNEGEWAAAYGLHAADTIRYLVTDPARDIFGVDPTTADYPFLLEWWGPLRRPYGRTEVHRVVQRPDGRIEATIDVVFGKRSGQRGITNIVFVREEGDWRLVSPLRRLPETTRLAAPPAAPLPVYLTAPRCLEDDLLTGERLRELGATPAAREPEPSLTYDDIDALPAGDLADEATADEIRQTIRQYFTCVAAGDWAAAFAFYTDDTLRYLITDPTRSFMDVNPTTANYPFLRHQRRLADGNHGRIDVYQVTRRPDGRIGAAIAIEKKPGQANRGMQYVVLAWEHGSWRLVSPLPSLSFPYGVNPATP